MRTFVSELTAVGVVLALGLGCSTDPPGSDVAQNQPEDTSDDVSESSDQGADAGDAPPAASSHSTVQATDSSATSTATSTSIANPEGEGGAPAQTAASTDNTIPTTLPGGSGAGGDTELIPEFPFSDGGAGAMGTGGTGTAGAGGMAGAEGTGDPPASPLDGCADEVSVTDMGCTGTFTCDAGRNVQVDCYQNDGANGPNCFCSGTGPNGAELSQAYRIDDLGGDHACTELASLCLAETPPQFPGTYARCESTGETAMADYCSVQNACFDDLEVARDFVISNQGFKSLQCGTSEGSTTVFCNCVESLGSDRSIDFSLGEVPVEGACGQAAAYCWSGEKPVFSGDADCSPYDAWRAAEETECNDAVQCKRTGTIGDAELQVTEVTSVTCLPGEDGKWSCACYLNNDSASFEVTPGAESATTCAAALPNCDAAFSAEMTSGTECDVTAEYSTEDEFCALQMSCSRTGPSGDLVVRRKDTVGLACNQDLDTGEWLCECTGNKTRQVVNFMRPAELSNDEVCRGAMDECVNSLDDIVGP